MKKVGSVHSRSLYHKFRIQLTRNFSKALWEARQRFTQFDELLEYISGIIFLATPHLTKHTISGSARLADILRSPSILAEPVYSLNTFWRFENVGQRFEEVNMRIPILSCFEGKPTNLNTSFWRQNNNKIVCALRVL